MKATRLLLTTLTLVALAAGAWAQTSTATTSKKRRAAAAAPAQPTVTAADVQSLRDAIAAQQQQIQQLTQQLQQNQQAWQQAQQQLQQVQSAASDAQQKAVSIQAASDQEQSTVAKLSTDVADVKGAMTSSVVSAQDEQKRVSLLESAIGKIRITGDMRVRDENFFQQGQADRNRARIRARFGLEGPLGEDFVGGIFLATGTLGDPTTTNETLTNFFDRKTIALDRGYLTYNPKAHKWLSLTGGKFAFPWVRTSVTFDQDINPEGADAKFSFDTHHGPIRNFTAQAMWLPISEASKGPDTFAAGGSVSGTLQFGPWTLRPQYTILNWRLPDAILSASAFAVGATSTGVDSTGTNNGSVPGEGPGCATIQNVPSPAVLSFPPCVFAANGMTNATYVTVNSSGVPTAHFLSGFLYSDIILNNTIKTGNPRFPINLLAEYEQNLNARPGPYDTTANITSLGKQDKSYYFDFSVGQFPTGSAAKKGDLQFGYSWYRIEQDAVIASFAESDQRAPTNILQNKFYANWRLQKNIAAQYTLWVGRTLNSSLENNSASINKTIKTAGDQESTLKRQQIDLVYTF